MFLFNSKKKRRVLKVSGMKCGHCKSKIISELKKLDEVSKVSINLDNKEVNVILKRDILDDTLEKVICDLGYEVESILEG